MSEAEPSARSGRNEEESGLARHSEHAGTAKTSDASSLRHPEVIPSERFILDNGERERERLRAHRKETPTHPLLRDKFARRKARYARMHGEGEKGNESGFPDNFEDLPSTVNERGNLLSLAPVCPVLF